MARQVQPRALRTRALAAGDGAAAAKLMRRITPMAPDLHETLDQVIDGLLADERVIGGLVEAYGAEGERRPVALTLSGFVPRAFRDRYVADPWPCLTGWLLAKALRGERGVFLDRAAQIAGNLGDGLDLIMLDYIQDPMDWTSEEGRRVMTSFMPLFLHIHRGYNFSSMTVEASIAYEPMALGAGYRTLAHLSVDPASDIVLPAGALKERGAYGVTRAEARLVPPSSPIAAVFTYHPPRFRFSAAEQRVLARAIEGLTDDEIAFGLRISHDAVKQSWRAIYDHVLTVMPEIAVRPGEAAAEGARGQEKRRRIAAYLRDNMQELRPHGGRRS